MPIPIFNPFSKSLMLADFILSTDLKVGDKLKLRIWRAGKEMNKTLILGKRNR